ncbi:MAG: hypothetical protein U1F87_18055 [Kiritimatiellia bacterium]
MNKCHFALAALGLSVLLGACVEFGEQIAPASQNIDPRMLGAWYNVDKERRIEFLHIYPKFPPKVHGYALVRHGFGADEQGEVHTGTFLFFNAGGRLFVQIHPDENTPEHGPIYLVDIKHEELVISSPYDSSYEQAVESGVLKGEVNTNSYSGVKIKITSPAVDVIDWLKKLPAKQFGRPDVYRPIKLEEGRESRGQLP